MKAKLTLKILHKALTNGSTFASVQVEVDGTFQPIYRIDSTARGTYIVYLSNRVVEIDGSATVQADTISKPLQTVWEQLR